MQQAPQQQTQQQEEREEKGFFLFRRSQQLTQLKQHPPPLVLKTPTRALTYENIIRHVKEGRSVNEIAAALSELFVATFVDEYLYSVTTVDVEAALMTMYTAISSIKIAILEYAKNELETLEQLDRLVAALAIAGNTVLLATRGLLLLNKPRRSWLALSKYGVVPKS
ncbi:MAG: hypothetical protein QXT13_07965 [Pyrobaculum sp.]